MRINAGKYRNHNIEMTNLETTRETSDKVRQAIFNLIGQFFDGEVVLDLFAGSGAIGLEAISRGAFEAYFNDINKQAIETVKRNALKLKVLEQCDLKNMDFKDYLTSINRPFDIIFLDPPYKEEFALDAIERMSELKLLKDEGIIIIETDEPKRDIERINKMNINYKMYDLRKYGRVSLIFLK